MLQTGMITCLSDIQMSQHFCFKSNIQEPIRTFCILCLVAKHLYKIKICILFSSNIIAVFIRQIKDVHIYSYLKGHTPPGEDRKERADRAAEGPLHHFCDN